MSETADNKWIVLCPGQGAQEVGMGKDWAARSPAARRVFEHANELLGFELSQVCFEGPADRLNRTEIAQSAIYVTSVACHAALVESGQACSMSAAAGLSLGEFTALHLASAFDFESGLRLVRLRGQAMQDASDAAAGGSGMVVLVGADESLAEDVCQQARNGDGHSVLVPANFNCPGQVVVSGSQTACDRAVEIASDLGLRASALAVSGAFHSPLMRPAAERLADALEQTSWQTPTVPVVSNVTARMHDSDIESIKRRLVEQLTQPVRWADSMRWIIDNVDGQFVELAPGKVLAGLMRRIDRETKIINHGRAPV